MKGFRGIVQPGLSWAGGCRWLVSSSGTGRVPEPAPRLVLSLAIAVWHVHRLAVLRGGLAT